MTWGQLHSVFYEIEAIINLTIFLSCNVVNMKLQIEWKAISKEVRGTTVWGCAFAHFFYHEAWHIKSGVLNWTHVSLIEVAMEIKEIGLPGDGPPPLSVVHTGFVLLSLSNLKMDILWNHLYMWKNKKFSFLTKSRATKIAWVAESFASHVWVDEVPLALFSQSFACY